MIACDLLNIDNIDDMSDALPEDERHTFLDHLSEKVVRLAWPQVDQESIRRAAVADDENQQPNEEDEEGELDDTVLYWENGQELEDTLPYYGDSGEEFDEPIAEVEDTEDSGDSVLSYSRCMLWRGLLHMVQTNAERCNNGDHMIADWRLDMTQFWNNNHYKYLILGHRLLAGVSGCLPPRMRNEAIWNSTANLVGKPGHNIALDLVNEFLNNEFKSNLKNCHGQYTDSQVSRCSKIVGSIGKAIEEIFYKEVVHDYIPKAAATDGSSRSKIKKFIQEYKPENLFTDRGRCDRHHTGFQNFEHKISIKSPEKLNTRLNKKICKQFGKRRIYI